MFELTVLIVIVVVVMAVNAATADRRLHVCRSCRSSMTPKMKTSGSILIEIILWLFLIVPGLIYSIWRLTTRRPSCSVCGSDDIIPVCTPEGHKIVAMANAAARSGNKEGE